MRQYTSTNLFTWFSGGFLGPENFLRAYADSWERFGYRQSPLEEMAYDAEAAFDAEKMVAEKLRLWKHMRPS